MAKDQATLYFNLLDYGLGGLKSLVDTKYKNAQKQEWWDDANNFWVGWVRWGGFAVTKMLNLNPRNIELVLG